MGKNLFIYMEANQQESKIKDISLHETGR